MAPAAHMHAWMRAASTAEQRELARRARTSRAYLYALAEGRREPSPSMAAALEAAACKMSATLPPLKQVDLSPVCRKCRYTKECRK